MLSEEENVRFSKLIHKFIVVLFMAIYFQLSSTQKMTLMGFKGENSKEN